MYLKTHEVAGKKLVAVCDRTLIGKSLDDGELSIHISEQFYKGEIVSEGDVASALLGATNINLVGEKAVKCAIDSGIVGEEEIIRIGDVPHAQIFVI